MILAGLLAVAYEEHIAHQGIQSVAQIVVQPHRLYLALGVALGLQPIVGVVDGFQEALPYRVGLLVEDAVEHPAGDKWAGEQLFAESQSVGLYLFACHAL